MKYIDAERLKESVQVEFDKGNLSKCPQGTLSEFGRGYHVAMSWVLSIIDSLQQEQPETDLEKEIERVVEHYNILANGGRVMKPSGIEKIARHFYKLGLNARKEDDK